jgi:hypothetical protein
MGRAGGGAVLLICRDARRISRYVEELIGGARYVCRFGVGRQQIFGSHRSHRPSPPSRACKRARVYLNLKLGSLRVLRDCRK